MKTRLVKKLIYKGYGIELQEMKDDYLHWFCSYIASPEFNVKDDLADGRSDCTFHQGIAVGFDTAHMYNHDMSIDEKKKDAIRQAKNWIDRWTKEKK